MKGILFLATVAIACLALTTQAQIPINTGLTPRLQISSLGDEVVINHIDDLGNYYLTYVVGDRLFIHTDDASGYNGVYTRINKVSFSLSPMLDKSSYGLFEIKKLSKFSAGSKFKYFFTCVAVKDCPFNKIGGAMEVFVDVEAGRGHDYWAHSIGFPNNYNKLLISYANKGKGDVPPSSFYSDYLNLLLGAATFNKMDNGTSSKMIAEGKNFMDGIYKNRSQVFTKTFKHISYAHLSQFDATNNCYHIEELKTENISKKTMSGLEPFAMSIKEGPLGFQNFRSFSTKFKPTPQKAALITKASPASADLGNAKVVLVVSYKPSLDGLASPGTDTGLAADQIEVYDEDCLANKVGDLNQQ